MKQFQISKQFKVASKTLYEAWLDSDLHTKMTGGEATCSKDIGGRFDAWDGYISGENVELVENKKIVQKWRTMEFELASLDSILELTFIDTEDGCILNLSHSNIPEGQPDYKQGWIDNYFLPMEACFAMG